VKVFHRDVVTLDIQKSGCLSAFQKNARFCGCRRIMAKIRHIRRGFADRLSRMPDDPFPSKDEIPNIQEEIGELVRRALIQAGDMQDVEEKLRGIVEKSSKATPPPERPGESHSAGEVPAF
jgi:hypothetical protein